MEALRQAAQKALEALEMLAQPTKTNNETPRYKAHKAAITALSAALAQEDRCGGENCLGWKADGVTFWVTEAARDAAVRAALAQQEQVACDTLAEYSGDGAQRKWVTVGAWLTPGERIVHLGPKAQTREDGLRAQGFEAVNPDTLGALQRLREDGAPQIQAQRFEVKEGGGK